MFAPVNYAGPQPFNDWFTPDTTQRVQLGLKVDAVDPYWGGGSFVYAKAGEALDKGNIVLLSAVFAATKVPNTANLGQPFMVAMATMAINTYGWFQISGLAVYKTNATVAADVAIGIAAAGILGTNAAGKQALGVHNLRSATATVTGSGQTKNGSSAIFFPAGYDGFFLGIALSGTGIPASTVAAKLDPDGKTIYTGSAIGTVGDKNATATGQVTVTGTYTGYGAGMIRYPFGQGAIT